MAAPSTVSSPRASEVAGRLDLMNIVEESIAGAEANGVQVRDGPARLLERNPVVTETGFPSNPFVTKTGFYKHMSRRRVHDVVKMVESTDRDDMVDPIVSHMRDLLQRVQEKMEGEGEPILRQLWKRGSASTATFNFVVHDKTLLGGYMGTIKQLIRYMISIRDCDPATDPPCRLNMEQSEALDTAVAYDWGCDDTAGKDEVAYQLVLSVLGHEIEVPRSPFENVALSCMAALALDRHQMAWKTALQYGSHLSAMVEVSLMMVYGKTISVDENRPPEVEGDRMGVLMQMIHRYVYYPVQYSGIILPLSVVLDFQDTAAACKTDETLQPNVDTAGKDPPCAMTSKALGQGLGCLGDTGSHSFFHFFGLPREIRDAIYKMCLHVGAIYFHATECADSDVLDAYGPWRPGIPYGWCTGADATDQHGDPHRLVRMRDLSRHGLGFTGHNQRMTRPMKKLVYERCTEVQAGMGRILKFDEYDTGPTVLGTFTCPRRHHHRNWYHHAVGFLEERSTSHGDPQPRLPMNVFLVNKQMCKEAREVFYKSNTFAFCACGKYSEYDSPGDLLAPQTADLFSQHISSGPGLSLITDIELHLTDESDPLDGENEHRYLGDTFSEMIPRQWNSFVDALAEISSLKTLRLNIAGGLPNLGDYLEGRAPNDTIARLCEIPQKLQNLHIKYVGGSANADREWIKGNLLPAKHKHGMRCYQPNKKDEFPCIMAEHAFGLVAFIAFLRLKLLNGGEKLGTRGIRAVWGGSGRAEQPQPMWLMAQTDDTNGATFEGDPKVPTDEMKEMAGFQSAFNEEYALGPVVHHPLIQKVMAGHTHLPA